LISVFSKNGKTTIPGEGTGKKGESKRRSISRTGKRKRGDLQRPAAFSVGEKPNKKNYRWGGGDQPALRVPKKQKDFESPVRARQGKEVTTRERRRGHEDGLWNR